MATALYHLNHLQHQHHSSHNIAPKYTHNTRRRRYSHDNIKDFFYVHDGESSCYINKNYQLENNNKINDDSDYGNEDDTFCLDHTTSNYNSINSKSVYYKALNTARLRKASSVLHNIIVESAYENMADPELLMTTAEPSSPQSIDNRSENEDFYEDSFSSSNESKHEQEDLDENIDKNNNKNIVTRRDKKVYKLRKHHSDYDIVYSQIEQGLHDLHDTHDNVDASPRPRSCISESSRNRTSSLEQENELLDEMDRRRAAKKSFSKSESNLLNSTLLSSSTSRVHKSTSHVDITSTQMYKDIYADNLRQYGFLLAKQLGISSHSPDQLRKTYLNGRKKALERRERANTSSVNTSRERIDSIVSHHRDRSSTSYSVENLHESFSPQRRLSTQSSASSSISDLRNNGSLTDISNIGMLEKHKKPATTVNRRKKGSKLPRDPVKRMSAPQLETIKINGIFNSNNAESYRSNTLPLRRSSKSTRSSLSVPDLSTDPNTSPDDSGSDVSSTHENEQSQRKLSDETIRRKNEARKKHEFRMSRLKSFEGVLSQANTWMKDAKAKSHDLNSSSRSNTIKEDTVMNMENNREKLTTVVKTIDASVTTPNGTRKEIFAGNENHSILTNPECIRKDSLNRKNGGSFSPTENINGNPALHEEHCYITDI